DLDTSSFSRLLIFERRKFQRYKTSLSAAGGRDILSTRCRNAVFVRPPCIHPEPVNTGAQGRTPMSWLGFGVALIEVFTENAPAANDRIRTMRRCGSQLDLGPMSFSGPMMRQESRQPLPADGFELSCSSHGELKVGFASGSCLDPGVYGTAARDPLRPWRWPPEAGHLSRPILE